MATQTMVPQTWASEQSVPTRAALLEELCTYTEIKHPTMAQHRQAQDTLRKALAYLLVTMPTDHKTEDPNWMGWQVGYVVPVMAAERCLREKDYWNACRKLVDLFRWSTLRPGVRKTAIRMLKAYQGTC